ncbi:Stk1 family PASTA domain-containing Ser/Thr kinase [Tomitella biformata]|uniref:Stk1 family PASTA domain-containing Ser/Thr kinase n=1 Tax=Tomitella biformata TaxID=630403 RepID=UPI00046624A8|nr:Stk1 family PASTA domain-containing Ser/Thr kinase [Tomitella biformata]
MSQIGARLVGTLLDNRYLVGSPIARGGMSTVYSGTDVRLGRDVAVKVMNTEFAADPKFLSRFEFEARSVASLKDPGLVAVYDQGVDGDYAFLVMELVRGGTLRELLRERGPMPPHAVVAVARPALTALAAAHRAGLVHRDVKPENVLISDDGEVKLADFGLVRAVAGATVTSSSVILGTAAYLSPEQVSTGHADPRSDIYAVGTVVFEMLTGRTPFTGDTSLAIAYRRINEDVPPPSTLIAGVPPELDAFVLRATDRDPNARFVNAADMGRSLDQLTEALRLPPFRVPAPTQSAQHRAAEAATHHIGVPDGGQTTILPPAAEHSASEAAPEPADPSHTRQYTMVGPPPLDPGAAEHDDAAQDSGGEPDSDDHLPAATPEVDRQRRRSRRSMALWLLVILALAAGLGVGGWWLGSGRYTTVPATAGMDQAAVLSALSSAGLDAQLDGAYSDTEPADTLMGVSPGPGTKVLRSSSVLVAVSLGRPTVPELDGDASTDTVLATLADRTLVPSLGSEEYSGTVPQGSVLRMNPRSGTVVRVGSTVTVVNSKGKPPVQVPNLKGKSQDDATEALLAAGLKVDGVRTEFDADTDGGKVFDADPEIGDMVPDGSKVTLLVSNALVVPDVAGKSPAEARDALTAAGLVPVDAGTASDTDAQAGTIGKSEPAGAGRVDPANPQVKIYVSDTVKVPSVLGQSVRSARAELTALGLAVDVQQIIGNDGSLVISQRPAAGSRVAQGKKVTVTALP